MILINNKRTDYHIVYSKDALEATRFAALELQKYLYKATLCCMPVYSDKCDRRGPEIHIGNVVRNQDYNSHLQKLSDEGSMIRLLENNDIVIAGKIPRADLYGVYHFLGECINLKCYHRDEICFEKKAKIEFEELNLMNDVVFEYREVYFTDAFDGTFASMNMLNSNLANLSSRLGGKMKWYNFHHSFSDLVSPDEYFEDHPEYFSEINGVRVKEHTELCLSNPEVFKIALAKIKKWLAQNQDCHVVSVAQDEWLGHFEKMACECPSCREIDDAHESQSASIIVFVNKIAKALEKEYPDLLIHTFAYQYSRKPPKRLKPHKNVIIRLTNIECSWDKSLAEGAEDDKNGVHALFINDLKGWSKITDRLYAWDYAVNYRNYLLPFPCLRSMYDNFLTYHDYQVKGLLMQGNFSAGGKGYLDELKSYVIARLLNGCDTPLELLIKEFCDHYYRGTSNWVYDYVMLFEDAVRGHKLWLYDDADNEMFTDELVYKARICIEKALALVGKKNDKVIYDRVLALSLSLRYLEIVRTPLDDKARTLTINRFYDDVRSLGITELFERTNLDYSIKVMRDSLYCKDRPDWYSLYYIMR